MSEVDGIEGAADGAMRTGLVVAGRIGEQLARMREEEQRSIAAAEEQRARELQERFDAQRAAARAQLAHVARDDWWDAASSEMIECVHETATAWKAYDPDAARASEKIRDQVQSRYGIDVDNAGVGETNLRPSYERHPSTAPDSDAWLDHPWAEIEDLIAGLKNKVARFALLRSPQISDELLGPVNEDAFKWIFDALEDISAAALAIELVSRQGLVRVRPAKSMDLFVPDTNKSQEIQNDQHH